MTALWDLPLSAITPYLDHAVDTENEKTAFDLWKSIYQSMVLEKIPSIGFKEFKETIFKKEKLVSKSAAEIEAEMNQVIAAHEGGAKYGAV